MADRGEIRVSGTGPSRRSSPGSRVAIFIAVAAGGFVALVGGSPGTESDRSAVTTPQPTTTTVATADPAPVVPAGDLDVPLDRLIPDFGGTLVLTMADDSGTAVWTWSSGPGGALVRSEPLADVYDARPDPSGTWVLGIHDYSGHSRLEAGLAGSPIAVFWGADSFAWSISDPGRVGWIEISDDTELPLHTGRHIPSGIWFVPAGRYLPSDPLARHVVVGLDDHGFVMQRISRSLEFDVVRVTETGIETGAAAGMFVGLSPAGHVAVSDGTSVRLHTGPELEPSARLGAPATSMRWAPGARRLAFVDREGRTVDIVEGAARTTVDIGAIRPRVLTWDATGRFVVLAGDRGPAESLLAFVDTVTLDVRTVSVSASPVAAAAR
jgi:hypothetical protein